VTDKQRVVIIPGDESEQGIDGYGGKDFENIMEGFKTSEDSTRPPSNVYFIYSNLTVLLRP